MPSGSTRPVEVFFSYAREDEEHATKLRNHLSILRRLGVISDWHDRQIVAGKEWENEIDQHLDSADIILLLVSADFLASDYCWGREMKRALERHERGEARVIPVAIRFVSWQGAPFAKLQGLPRDVKPVTSWDDIDQAYSSIATGLQQVIANLQADGRRPLAKPEKKAASIITPLERMMLALTERKFKWRSLERLRILGGVATDDEALSLLRTNPKVRFSKGRSGDIIVTLEE